MNKENHDSYFEVVNYGDIKPSDIGGSSCDGCKNNVGQFRGMVIEGITEELKRLIMGPHPSMIEKTEEINKELLDALEKCMQAIYFNQNNLPDSCKELLNDTRKIVKKYRGR